MAQNQLSNGVPLRDDEVRQEQQLQIIPRSSVPPSFEHGFLRLPQFNDQDVLRQVLAYFQKQLQSTYAIVGSALIGLELEKTESLAELIEMKLSAANENSGQIIMQQPRPKMKAEHFQIKRLEIGDYKLRRLHGGHLVAKSYFAKRKLVWEILDGVKKKKIEFLWDDISNIRANLPEGTLEIMLQHRPSFHCETKTTPMKHTAWKLSEDFTGHEASTIRKHIIEFEVGDLGKLYSKLIECDENLRRLSLQPFPDLEPPYFTSFHNQRTTNPTYKISNVIGSNFNQASSSTGPVPLLLPSTEQDRQFRTINSVSSALDISSKTEVINNNSQQLIQDSRPAVSHGGYADPLSTARKQTSTSTPSPQKVHEFKDLITLPPLFAAVNLSTSPAFFDTCRAATEVINDNQRFQHSKLAVQRGPLFDEFAHLKAKNSMLSASQQQPSSSTAAPMPSAQQVQQFRCAFTLPSSLAINNSTLGISNAGTEVINDNQMFQDSEDGGVFDEYPEFTADHSLLLPSASDLELLESNDEEMKGFEACLHSKIDEMEAETNSSAAMFAAPPMQLQDIENNAQIDDPHL